MLKTRRFERILVIVDLITSISEKRRVLNIFAKLVLKSFIYSIIVYLNLCLKTKSQEKGEALINNFAYQNWFPDCQNPFGIQSRH